jgi:hypothetical protein
MNDSWCIIICLLLLDNDRYCQSIRHRQLVERMIHSHYRKEFHKELDIIVRRLRQGKIPRCCLHPPKSEHMVLSVKLTGLDRRAFVTLCGLFAPVFDSYSPFVPSGESCFYHMKQGKKGRPQKIRPEDGLGLVLAWTRTWGSLMALQLIFRMMYSNLGDYLLFGKRILVRVLHNHPLAQLHVPSRYKATGAIAMSVISVKQRRFNGDN